MMQFCVSTLILLLMIWQLPASAAHYHHCSQVNQQDISEQIRQHGTDPGSIVKKVTNVLHNQFKKSPKDKPNRMLNNSSDIRIQMSVIYSYFSLVDWTNRIEGLEAVSALDSSKSSEIDYAFTHWVRAKYLSAVRELARERELFHVFREPAYSKAQRNEVVNEPVSLMITGYAPFTCASDWDQNTYDCSKSYVMVTTQLSPSTLCRSEALAKQGRFKFIVDVSSPKFKVVDIEYGDHRLYQDSLIDLKSMLSTMQPELVIKRIKLWSHTDTKAVPAATLMAFKKYLDQSKTGDTSRMPASTSK